MRKRSVVALAAGAVLLVAVVTAAVARPDARAQALLDLNRKWTSHWPFDHGKRLVEGLAHELQPSGSVWVQVEPGIRMHLDPYDLVSRMILETGSWEPESWRLIEARLRPGDTFVDIGAHIGYYSLKAAAAVGPGGKVIAIEPNPATLVTLHENAQASAARQVAIEPVACADTEATLQLFAAPRSNTGESSLSKANAGREGAVSSYTVRARPLDDIVREHGLTRVDYAKIDVEGAEMIVLKGAIETLTKFHPYLLIEVVDSQLRSMGASAVELTTFLEAHGYKELQRAGQNIEFGPSGR